MTRRLHRAARASTLRRRRPPAGPGPAKSTPATAAAAARTDYVTLQLLNGDVTACTGPDSHAERRPVDVSESAAALATDGN